MTRLLDYKDKQDYTFGDNNVTTTSHAQYYQFEPGKISSQATQDILEDTTSTTYGTGGTITRSATEKANKAAGDYQKYDY